MPFQFRFFKQFTKNPPKFDELDLYFVKSKLNGVGVKARFAREENFPQNWSISNVQIKLISNLQEIRKGKTVIQKWKKISSTKVFLKVYNCKYIYDNANKFAIGNKFTIQEAIKNQLANISNILESAFLSNKEIQEKYYAKNQDLRNWMNKQYKLTDIFLVQKNRTKSKHKEFGVVRVTPLYNLQQLKSKVFETQAFEFNNQSDVLSAMKKSDLLINENISYPSLLDKIYFKKI